MGKSVSDVSDRMVALEKSNETLTKEYKKLSETYTDLENRSQGLRMLNCASSVTLRRIYCSRDWGKKTLIRPLSLIGLTGLWPSSLVRMNIAITVCLRYYSEKEKILKLPRKNGWLLYNCFPIHIFSDVSPEVGLLRASFSKVKAKLQDIEIQYSLYFQARIHWSPRDWEINPTQFTSSNRGHVGNLKKTCCIG